MHKAWLRLERLEKKLLKIIKEKKQVVCSSYANYIDVLEIMEIEGLISLKFGKEKVTITYICDENQMEKLNLLTEEEKIYIKNKHEKLKTKIQQEQEREKIIKEIEQDVNAGLSPVEIQRKRNITTSKYYNLYRFIKIRAANKGEITPIQKRLLEEKEEREQKIKEIMECWKEGITPKKTREKLSISVCKYNSLYRTIRNRKIKEEVINEPNQPNR
jgi:hypothetical protein